MFLRRKILRQSGKEYVYWQLVENERRNGKVRQKVICTIGREEEMDRDRVDKMVAALAGQTHKLQVLDLEKDLILKHTREYGALVVLQRLWDELGIGEEIRRQIRDRAFTFDVEAAIRGMVFNRLLDPFSDRGTYDWLVNDADFPEAKSLSLHQLYRALDVLHEYKEPIEEGLFLRMRDLFSLDVSLVFYDATLIRSYGRESELIQYGRDGELEFLLTLANSREGLPFAHEVEPGATADVSTVKRMVDALQRRFHITHCIFVGDRGMLSEENLELLREAGIHYIVGCPLRRAGEVRDVVLAWPGRYREVAENLRVKEVRVEDRRYIVCFNPIEAEYDRQTRESIVEELRAELEGLDPWSRKAARLYSHPGKGRYLMRLDDGRICLDEARIQEEARYDGKYVIRTSYEQLDNTEVAKAYRDLQTIERSFRSLKSLEEINPVYHWRERRIRAHVHVCVLAHLLERYLEKKLHAKGIKMTAAEALKHLSRIKSAHMDIKGTMYRLRSEASPEAVTIFQALGYRIPPRIEPLAKDDRDAKTEVSRAQNALV